MTLSITSRRPPSPRRGILRLLSAGAATVVLAGCASFSPDGGFATVEQTTQQRLGKEVRWARSDSDRQLIHQRVRIEEDQGTRFVHTSFRPSGSGAHSMEPFSGQAVLNRREKRRWVGLMTIRFASGKTRATPWGRLKKPF